MQAPPVPENCPPGLEYLTQTDQLLIKQQVELLEGTCLHDYCFKWLRHFLKILVPSKKFKLIRFTALPLTFFLAAFTGFETNNKYKILNSMGQQVFFAAEGE